MADRPLLSQPRPFSCTSKADRPAWGGDTPLYQRVPQKILKKIISLYYIYLSKGHTEVMSPAKFVAVVRVLARVHWKINVRPSGTCIEEEVKCLKDMKSSHLYCSGCRKVD